MALAPGLKRRGGLFGAPSQTPATVTGGGGVFGGGQPPVAAAAPAAPRKGFDWAKALGVLGDSLSILGGGQAQYVPNLIAQRQFDAERQAMAQRDAAQRAAGLEDWVWKEEYGRRNPKPVQPHRWERNDGSLMEIGPDGSPRVAYEDPTPKMMFLPDGAGGGRWVAQPGVTGPTQGGAPKTLPSTFDGWDADEAPPISAAPQRPNTIARSAYQAWVNEYGQQEADNIMRRNGFTVGNY